MVCVVLSHCLHRGEAMKKAIKLISIFVIIFIISMLIFDICDNALATELSTEELMEIYTQKKHIGSLVILCDSLEIQNDVRLIEYLDDAMSIDNDILISTIDEYYDSKEMTEKVIDMGGDIYKGRWISTALAICANNGDKEKYKELMMDYLPMISYKDRMVVLSLSYEKYNTSFLVDNIDVVVEALNHLYETSNSNIDKAKYLSMLSSLYSLDETSKEKAKQLYSEIALLADTQNNHEVIVNDIVKDYDKDCAFWNLMLRNQKKTGDGSLIDTPTDEQSNT